MYDELDFIPITYENSARLAGPFYHGTAARLQVGDLLIPGFGSNYQKGRVANHIYFSTIVAGLAAELASALTGRQPEPRRQCWKARARSAQLARKLLVVCGG